ncbi:C39 family peptidase [Streptomyces sp. NPDC059637]|uniref:C39 family peptidase n=1 Tax=Streptomyces sp. NPDC059637 TaxID=3347752 RepID=UPI0036D10433
MPAPTPRRAVLAAALATAATAAAPAASARAATSPDAAPGRGGAPARGRAADPTAPAGSAAPAAAEAAFVGHRSWATRTDWNSGTGSGTRVVPGPRPGIALDRPTGTLEYTDPHTGTTATWETATWTSRTHRLERGATEAVPSWNAHTPPGTWIRIELRGTYGDGSTTPWYVMGHWASGDSDADIRRTSVDDQGDGRSTVWTDTLSLDDPASGLRLTAHQLRLTLLRRAGSNETPTVWRAAVMASDVPDRFEVPASRPGVARGVELRVPRYSQEIHVGQYPEYDNGGEAWCSPTSSQMVIEHWGRGPAPEDLAWVDPAYADPQVCHAARLTYDHQYAGCGNWPFNAAYAAGYPGMQATVTRLRSMDEAELLVRAGIPLITSQSFLESELDGAGYGTAGHLMCLVGFTGDGDVVANDPASESNEAVRRVYDRRQWENIWLRTKRYDAKGNVRSGTGGVCYVYWPTDPSPAQRRALADVGIR